MEKEAVGIINACSNLVAQLDAHPAGAGMFVCCFSMLLLVAVVFCLARPRGTDAASRKDKSS
jgi:hypothetical protein